MTRRLLRAAAPFVLAATALVAVSACDSSNPAQSDEHSVIAGVNATVGQVLIRNANIVVDESGTTGQLYVALVNDAGAADQLTSVTSPDATFALPATGASASASASASDSASNSASASASTSAGASSSTSTSASPSASPTAGGGPVELQAGAAVFLNQPTATIAITEITSPLRIGESLTLTMTFASAGSVTLTVPVVDSSVPEAGGLETAPPAASQAGAEQDGVVASSDAPFAASTSVQPTTTAPAASSSAP